MGKCENFRNYGEPRSFQHWPPCRPDHDEEGMMPALASKYFAGSGCAVSYSCTQLRRTTTLLALIAFLTKWCFLVPGFVPSCYRLNHIIHKCRQYMHSLSLSMTFVPLWCQHHHLSLSLPGHSKDFFHSHSCSPPILSPRTKIIPTLANPYPHHEEGMMPALASFGYFKETIDNFGFLLWTLNFKIRICDCQKS